MRIAIVSLGRSHLIHLAKYLHENTDADVTFYTMMPKSRCRKFGYTGKVKSFLFPVGVGELFIRYFVKADEYKKSYMRFRLTKFFDRLVSMSLRKCDVLIGLNGSAVESSRVAKKKYGATVICDQGSSHILVQNEAHYTYSDVPVSEYSTSFMLRHYDVSDYFMVASDYVLDSDIRQGIARDRILENPYGVNLETFHPTDNPSHKPKTYDVITVGSWWKHKGCDLLMEACINRLGLSLLHVGSVVDCPLSDSPLFSHIDFVPESELPSYYAKARVFAMCSLDEGFGLVLLQAAGCGLPVVGSSRTGLSAMAKLLGNPEQCIEISEPLCVENIVAALKKALEIADRQPDGMRKPYGNALENISWKAYGQRYYDILKRLTLNQL